MATYTTAAQAGAIARRSGGKAVKKRTFEPFVPEQPPAGLYDPAFDATQGATQRGLFDLAQDTQTQNLRDTTDYGLGMDAVGRSQTRGLQDLDTRQQTDQLGFDRSTQDINTNLQRGQANYDQSVQALTRNYGRLGVQQREGQSRAGVQRGGAMLQAAAKRAANQGLDRQPLDTNWANAQQDAQTQLGRIDQNRTMDTGQLGQARTRLGEDADLQRGMLGLQGAPPDANNPYGGRSWQDRTTALTRASREAYNQGLDTDVAKTQQATSLGWTPPTMPSNERIDPATGLHRQLHYEGNMLVATDPTGKVLYRRPRTKV